MKLSSSRVLYGALFAGAFAATLYFVGDMLRKPGVEQATVGNAEETTVHSGPPPANVVDGVEDFFRRLLDRK